MSRIPVLGEVFTNKGGRKIDDLNSLKTYSLLTNVSGILLIMKRNEAKMA